ncbi:MAG: DUF115 domain-containing protein [Gammaproteobacteria bacterium]|nr:DUF115 domain-containing protein [Gammaproteobacteria bacterium]
MNKKTKTDKISDMLFDLLYSINNTIRYTKYLVERYLLNQHSHLSLNTEIKDIHKGKNCFVLGNGPSLKQQDITRLKDQCVFMVNRAFLDENYAVIKPCYHIIVDNKLATGQWPITYLDDIAKINPDVTFILNSKWFNDSKFVEYKVKYKIIWIDLSLELTRFNTKAKIDLTKRSLGKNVVENGIITAVYMGFKQIYITGVDGDGFANLLLGVDSHSYGVNKDDLEKFQSWVGVREALNSVCRWMLSWHYLDKYTLRNGSKIINLTGRGIITMVEMDSYSRVIGEIND